MIVNFADAVRYNIPSLDIILTFLVFFPRLRISHSEFLKVPNIMFFFITF